MPPPTLNYEEPSKGCSMPCVKGETSGSYVTLCASIQGWVKIQSLIAHVDGRSFFDGSPSCVH